MEAKGSPYAFGQEKSGNQRFKSRGRTLMERLEKKKIKGRRKEHELCKIDIRNCSRGELQREDSVPS